MAGRMSVAEKQASDGHSRQPVHGDGADDDEERDRQEVFGSWHASGHQRSGEGRRCRAGHDFMRVHRVDERPLAQGQWWES